MKTIAAISTGLGKSGIGIIRISGEESFSIAEKIYRTGKGNIVSLEQYQTHTVHYGQITENGQILDKVLLVLMRGPHSYTGEDTVEIQCHGGPFVLKSILEAVYRAGAIPAEPGEFTKRAFLNGRLDLAQAEAVMDLIDSSNQYARKSALNQLKGKESRVLQELREKILYHTAFIEAAIDDPEHYSVDGYGTQLEKELDEIRKTMEELLRHADDGRIMREGIRTVIVGKPNVGKSTLLNALAGKDRAIVTEIPGTTRDALEESVLLGDLQLILVDTAGIHETTDKVEQIGVSISKEQVQEADLVLLCVDAAAGLSKEDYEILSDIKEQPILVLVNKGDLVDQGKINAIEKLIIERNVPKRQILVISAKEQTGLDRLEEKIREMFFSGEVDYNNEVIITSLRHKALLTNALQSVKNVEESIRKGLPEDFYSIDLMDAYQFLGEITGETAGEDLVNEIFSKFCMGK